MEGDRGRERGREGGGEFRRGELTRVVIHANLMCSSCRLP